MVKLVFDADPGTLQDVRWGFHRPPPWCKPTTILDLGANIGLTLIDYAEMFPDAELIVGVELDQANYEIACENVLPFKNVVVVHAGVATWNGWCEYDPAAATNAFRIIPGAAKQTAAVTIDSLLDDYFYGGVDFMKVDIEGAEREIFKTPATWPQRVRCLSMECHYGYEPDEAVRDLQTLGYHAEIYNFGQPAPGMQEHWVVWARIP